MSPSDDARDWADSIGGLADPFTVSRPAVSTMMAA